MFTVFFIWKRKNIQFLVSLLNLKDIGSIVFVITKQKMSPIFFHILEPPEYFSFCVCQSLGYCYFLQNRQTDVDGNSGIPSRRSRSSLF